VSYGFCFQTAYWAGRIHLAEVMNGHFKKIEWKGIVKRSINTYWNTKLQLDCQSKSSFGGAGSVVFCAVRWILLLMFPTTGIQRNLLF
jgi:hypothetical protein